MISSKPVLRVTRPPSTSFNLVVPLRVLQVCVVGSELVCSETIVAVNEERLVHNPGVGLLLDALEPSIEDHADKWRQRIAAKLGDSLI